jgi:hypothetical protein
MKKVFRLTENKLINRLKRLIKEDEIEEVEISPEEYIELLKKVFFQAQAIPKLPKFKGKKLVVKGNLDLTDFNDRKQLVDLGPIKIEGNLNASYTNIQNLDNIEVTGSMRYWSTPYNNIMDRRAKQKKYDKQQNRRELDDWNLDDTDEEGEKANVAFMYAEQEGNITVLSDEDKERLEYLRTRLSELETQMENEDDEEKYDELSEEYDEVQEEIDGFEDYVDVYDFYPNGTHFYMTSFESLSTGDEYAVGTEYEADKSLDEYIDDLVNDASNVYDNNFLSNYIDGRKVRDEFEYAVDEWVRESPDSYNVEKGLSDDQEEEIWLLEMEKWVYENEGVRAPISEPTREDGDVFDFEDAEGNRFQYRNMSADPSLYKSASHWVLHKDGQVVSPHQIYDDEDTDEHQEARDERISDIDYEIEEIKDNPDGEPDEDDIEQAVEEYLDGIEDDPLGFLQDMGYSNFKDFIDEEELRDDLARDYDYGDALNSYDSSYDEFTVNGTRYIVMKYN